MDYVVAIVTACAWPTTVLILAVAFRAELVALLRRLRTADLAERVLHFGESPTDRELPARPGPAGGKRRKPKSLPHSKWDKPATLFWLGNDLMWIQDMLFRGAPRDRIIEGLKHARQYAEALGLAGTFTVDELTRLIEYFEGGPDHPPVPLILDQIPGLARQIELVKRDVASRAEESQPGFAKLRSL